MPDLRVILGGLVSLALAGPVLQHRMAVTFAARAEGIGLDDVVARLTAALR
jgi:MoxR-like ATPase